MSFNFRFATALLVGLALTSAQARAADIIIGNLPQTNDIGAATLSTTSFQAVSFTMGSVDYTLDSVVIRLENFFSTGVTPVIQIRDDGGLNPGTTVLADFTNPVGQGGGIFNYTFTPNAPFTLSASTKYWLYAATSSSSLFWTYSSPGVTPSGIATFNSYRRIFNSNWVASNDYNSFQITGTVVPEPSTYMLGGLATGVMAFVARRRKASRNG